MENYSLSENFIRKNNSIQIDSNFSYLLLPDQNRFEIMKKFQRFTSIFLRTKYLKPTVFLICLTSIYSLHLIYKNLLLLDNQSAKKEFGSSFAIETFSELNLQIELLKERLSRTSNKNDHLLEDLTILRKKLDAFQQKLDLYEQPKYRQKSKEKEKIQVVDDIFDNWTNETFITNQLYKKYLKSEADIFSYSAFTLDKYFPAELGLFKQNIIKLRGLRRQDFESVIQSALKQLNKNSMNENQPIYSFTDFLIGFYRSTPLQGYEYELYFRKGRSCCSLLKFNRAIEKLTLRESTLLDAERPRLLEENEELKKIVNFVLPLSKHKLKEFKLFLSSFETNAIQNDDAFVTLNIVFEHSNDSDDIKKKRLLDSILEEFKARTGFYKCHVIYVNSSIRKKAFSRANLLQIGIENLSNDDLVFICDVDVLFNANFLDLCRFNAIRNKRVFFPILYSFYNPKFSDQNKTTLLVEKLEDRSIIDQDQDEAENVLNEEDEESTRVKLIINKNSGWWRDTGFGMVCIYKEDFQSIGGFSTLQNFSQTGWGGEDLRLLKKIIKSSNLDIFRAITPGLFHLYHPKTCDQSQLDSKRYQDCLKVKIFNEASHLHFGASYFNVSITNN